MATVVNVASVPKRSPFRYPGGKTWLIPIIRNWLSSLGTKPRLLVEPFAGGGIVGLTAGFEGLADHVHLNELDPDVSAVWRTIISDRRSTWLAERIREFELNERNVKEALAIESSSIRIRAFQTILKNRVQRGGILAPGAGLMKEGENGKGLASRWYPETLARRILEIGQLAEKFEFTQDDALRAISLYKHRKTAVFFVDPPYTVAGTRLYRFSEIDHEALFKSLKEVEGGFMMTYDNANEIKSLAEEFGFDTENVLMKNTHHSVQSELVISRNLEWLRQDSSSSRGERFALQSASV